nr:hypothetical protein GCM10020063_053570 [Dactylosporangium thailandense]
MTSSAAPPKASAGTGAVSPGWPLSQRPICAYVPASRCSTACSLCVAMASAANAAATASVDATAHHGAGRVRAAARAGRASRTSSTAAAAAAGSTVHAWKAPSAASGTATSSQPVTASTGRTEASCSTRPARTPGAVRTRSAPAR